ncbi:hypothetical protein MHBO_003877 [Bonamia ostreae]|uniref:Uncharacterized protein n=1 Tax=Bonamia ostreae TaxID=126728 RepID=A0ABV2ARS0_9EUKA
MVNDLKYSYKAKYVYFDDEDKVISTDVVTMEKEEFKLQPYRVFPRNADRVEIHLSIMTYGINGRSLDYMFRESPKKVEVSVMREPYR